MEAKITYRNTDEYISTFPDDVQQLLEKMRSIVLKAVPHAKEVISYNMPAFEYEGRMLLYFAGYKRHIGFYPTGSGIAAFKAELTGYEISKGTVRFPLDKPLPVKLITTIAKFRAKENKEKAAARLQKKKQ